MTRKHFNQVHVGDSKTKCIVRVITNHLEEFKQEMLKLDENCLKKFKDMKYEKEPKHKFKEWWDIPEYSQDISEKSWGTIDVYIEPSKLKSLPNIENSQKNSFWFPSRPIFKDKNTHWTTTEECNPKYPIYVISKGRWKKRLTCKCLDKMGVPYKLVVEEQELEEYVKHGQPRDTILTLPQELCNLGQGSIPVRNYVWDHSMENGHKRHWVLDDNIKDILRFNKCSHIPIRTGLPFHIIEKVVDRYKDVYLSGMNYKMFCPEIDIRRERVQMNTRVYSCILIQNDCPFRWRGRYNEDTDLSLRVLKEGHVTLLFNNFLCDKLATNTCKGGNTSSIYSEEDGMYKKAKSLQDQHPDVVKISDKKFVGKKAYHHVVDYKPFKQNELTCIDKPKNKKTNEYGLQLVKN